jgi:hypothetical protein
LRKFDAAVIRPLVAGLILVGLAVGIWALWPRENSDPSPTTVPVAVETTTTTLLPTTTTTLPTTSTTADTHVVATVEEAEEILRALWYGWFEGIYNQDEDRIREVVGSSNQIEAAVAQFGQLEVTRPPAASDFAFSGTEILEASPTCTAIWTEMSATGFGAPAVEGVHVFRWSEGKWLFISLWTHQDDLWEGDCAAEF